MVLLFILIFSIYILPKCTSKPRFVRPWKTSHDGAAPLRPEQPVTMAAGAEAMQRSAVSL